MTVAQGGCLCGDIRYDIAQAPEKITMCHCSFCQRSTGAAYMVQPALGADALRVTRGVPKVYTHISSGSGKAIQIHFCDRCGTKLYQRFDRFGGAIGLYSGTLDDLNWLQVRVKNAKHIFVDQARAETTLPAQMPLFDGHALAADDTPLAPSTLDHPCTAAERSAERSAK